MSNETNSTTLAETLPTTTATLEILLTTIVNASQQHQGVKQAHEVQIVDNSLNTTTTTTQSSEKNDSDDGMLTTLVGIVLLLALLALVGVALALTALWFMNKKLNEISQGSRNATPVPKVGNGYNRVGAMSTNEQMPPASTTNPIN